MTKIVAALFFILLGALPAAAWTHGQPSPLVSCNFTGATCFNGANVPLSTEISVSNSGGLALNATGVYQSFPPNVPRTTNQGLLVEAASTNLVTQSSTFTNAAWTQNNVALTANAVVSPDGATDASFLVDNATNGTHNIFQTIGSATGGQVYTVSAFVKGNTLTTGGIGLGNNGLSNYFFVFFDTNIGAIQCFASSGTCLSSSITPLGTTGWYHVCTTGTLTATQTAYMAIATSEVFASTTSYPGFGLGFYVWNAQVELGSYCSSPIVTTTSTATRSADVVTTTGGLQSLLNASSGVAVACADQAPGGTVSTLWGASGAALLGTTAADLGSVTITSETDSPGVGRWPDPNCIGVSWNSSGRSLSLDGMTVATDTVAMTPSTAGFLGSTAGTSNFCNCYITSVQIFSSNAATFLSSFTPQGKPHIPAPAVALNFPNSTFFDEFNKLSTIDVNNTLAPGFNWYTSNVWPNISSGCGTPTPSSDYAIVNGILQYTLYNGCTNELGLNSAAHIAASPNYVGNVFPGGFCAQYRFAVSTASSPAGNSSGWPIIWEYTVEGFLSGSTRTTEWDMMEWFPSSTAGVPNADANTLHDWPTNTDYVNLITPALVGANAYTLGQFHTGLSCWTTQAKSPNGFGLTFTQIDGQLQGPTAIYYKSNTGATPAPTQGSNFNGVYSAWDSQNPILILAAGQNNPLYLDVIQIWQGPGHTLTGTTFDPANAGPYESFFNNNLIAVTSGNNSGNYQAGRSTTSHATGQYYFECKYTVDGGSGGDLAVGIMNGSASVGVASGGVDPGLDANLSIAAYGTSTAWELNGGTTAVAVTPFDTDTVGIALDATNHLVWQIVMHAGGVSTWNGSASANPATGVGGQSISAITGPYYAGCFGNPNANGGNPTVFGTFAPPYQLTTNGGTVPAGFGNF